MVVLPFYNCVVMPNVRIMADVMQHSEVSDNALENVNGSGISDCALINFNGSGVSDLPLVLPRHRSECSGVCSVMGFP